MSEFPKKNPNPHEDPMHGIEPWDRLVDSSLEEILGDARPLPIPSMYERIATRETSKLFTENQLDLIAQRALAEVQAKPVTDRVIPRPSKRKWLPLGSLAACVAIAMLIGWWSTGPKTDQQTTGTHQSHRHGNDWTTHPEPTERQAIKEEPIRDGSSRVLAQSQASDSIRQTLEPTESDTPSHPQKSSAEQSSERSLVASDMSSGALRKRPLGEPGDREVASVIDSQFDQIWNQVSEQESKVRNINLSVDRIARLLLRRAPTNAELESIRREKLTSEVSVVDPQLGDLSSLADRWISSEEFDRVWADSLASFYLGGIPISGETQKIFRDWLEEQIRSDVPIQEIQRSVLLGLWEPEHPAFCLLEAWAKRSIEPRIRGSQWVDMDQAEISKLTGSTQFFIKVTGNVAIGCTQCHGHESPDYPAWLSELLLANAKASIAKPVVFDSIAALLVQAVLPGRSELFSKQQDDRINKIMARLPDGKRIATEDSVQQAVNAWIERGSHDQGSLIQALWKDFFGEALCSDFGLDSDVAVQERRDLLEFLGKKAVEKGAGVRQIVYWMLISKPTRQPEEPLSYPQYMAYDSQKLRDYWADRAVFKSLLLKSSPGEESKPEPIDRFALSVFPERAHWLERSLLAQPSNPIAPPPKTSNVGDTASALSAGEAPGWSRSMLKTEMRFKLASDRSKQWAHLMAQSNLSDPQVVEHAYLMSKHRFPTPQEHKAWADRGWSRSERSSAILRLLAGVESYEQ